jgi:hypothetical protein
VSAPSLRARAANALLQQTAPIPDDLDWNDSDQVEAMLAAHRGDYDATVCSSTSARSFAEHAQRRGAKPDQLRYLLGVQRRVSIEPREGGRNRQVTSAMFTTTIEQAVAAVRAVRDLPGIPANIRALSRRYATELSRYQSGTFDRDEFEEAAREADKKAGLGLLKPRSPGRPPGPKPETTLFAVLVHELRRVFGDGPTMWRHVMALTQDVAPGIAPPRLVKEAEASVIRRLRERERNAPAAEVDAVYREMFGSDR